MFWICDYKSVDNKSVGVAFAEGCLHSVNAFFASHTALPVIRLEVTRSWGRDTAGTDDPN